MKKLNAVLSFTFASLISISPPAFAKGVDGGGGDKCQDRIEEIRNDLSDWIQAGGSRDLDFSKTKIDLAGYNSKMESLFALTRSNDQGSISCTDNPALVTVDGAEKTCRAYFESPSSEPKILCYRGKNDGQTSTGFMGLSENDQYFQVHHEFAVLAGIEDQAGESSDYPLSDQISGFLQYQTIKKLAVKVINGLQQIPEEQLPKYETAALDAIYKFFDLAIRASYGGPYGNGHYGPNSRYKCTGEDGIVYWDLGVLNYAIMDLQKVVAGTIKNTGKQTELVLYTGSDKDYPNGPYAGMRTIIKITSTTDGQSSIVYIKQDAGQGNTGTLAVPVITNQWDTMEVATCK